MDDLTARIQETDRKAREAEKRGYPKVPMRCWECGKVTERDIGAVSLEDWLKWEAEGRRVLSGTCPEHDLSEMEEADD